MPKFSLFIAALTLLGALAALPRPALADEHPSGNFRPHIEAKLQGMGFGRWGEIERSDNGRAWKVDDARLRDGGKYELRLSTDDPHEISRHMDDQDRTRRLRPGAGGRGSAPVVVMFR